MSELSRRAVLSTGGRAAVATLALGGLSVAATDPTADAELFQLEAAFNDAKRIWLAEDEEASASSHQLDEDFPIPDFPAQFCRMS